MWESIFASSITLIGFIVAFIIIYYLFSFTKMKKQKKYFADLHTGLAEGQKVQLSNGIFGTVRTVGKEMDYNILQILLIFLITFIAAIDQFSFLECLYQPIVTGMVVGLILGDLQTGLIVGGTYQLMTIGNSQLGELNHLMLLSVGLWLQCLRLP